MADDPMQPDDAHRNGSEPVPLPDALEERAFEILLAPADTDRDATFTALLVQHPEHEAELRHLQARLRSGETALRESGLADDEPPQRIGPYRLVRKLGEGGFGVVWLADQQVPIQRQVALKLVRPGRDTDSVLRRFEAEREVMARFDHPCIARVLDAGRTADGQPFLVTEFVAGEPLNSYVERRRLPLRDRLALMQRIAEAVEHAHQRGVIHRDLKPSNVLVAEIDGRPWPKIIDFGVARALGHRGDTAETRAGGLVGTPEYMSPEQALGDPDVDVRTDVYALGVMLFELLVGDLPQGRANWRKARLSEIVAWLQDGEAPRPSDVARDPSLRRRLRGELDWIVGAALARDRRRRYPSARGLADDLAHHLANRPVGAGPPSALYQLRKFVRRHRAPVAAAAIVLLTLLAGFTTSLLALRRARAAERHLGMLADQQEVLLREFGALADVIGADELRREFDELWPARPDRAEGFASWLDRAMALLDRSVERDRIASSAAERAAAAGDPAAAFLARTLVNLRDELLGFTAASGLIPMARAGHEWSLAVAAATVDGAADRWQQACDEIARNPRYGGLRLRPQLGLVPLGIDPDSGLYEFLHLQSGKAPGRDASGRIVPGEAMGIVLVLLPGGTTNVGVQQQDPNAPHYDPHATLPNLCVHRVELDPFFLAKFEVTRAQWQRAGLPGGTFFELGTATGQGPLTDLHPAENLSRQEAATCARRFDLALPTDAQWEYACRAGSTTVWHTGDAPESLTGFANIAGAEVGDLGAPRPFTREARDGHAISAPVGSYRPNAFGLHDLHGNIAEVCADSVVDPRAEPRAGDGRRLQHDERLISVRGGSFADPAERARSGGRNTMPQHTRMAQVGVRLARAVQ